MVFVYLGRMISIIGAGPSGNYLAYLLAKNGFYEEHKKIGKPVQCTGLITSSLDSVCKVDEDCIVNKIGNVRLIAPNNEGLDLKLSRKNYVVDRAKFDSFFSKLALGSGAKLNLNSKLTDFNAAGNKINMRFNSKKIETDILVGADGVNSAVNKEKLKFVIGMQGRFRGDFDADTFTVYLGLGKFSWIVPESRKIARIGVIGDNVNNAYNELLKKGKFKFIESQSGIVPIYNPKLKTQTGNVFLLGDAAGMVKATTYGGILYGLMGAEELYKAIKENKDYDNLWRKRFGNELYLSLILRKMLDKMDMEDYNNLVKRFNKDSLKNLLEEHDRDFPSKFLFKLILKEPTLLKYLKLIF